LGPPPELDRIPAAHSPASPRGFHKLGLKPNDRIALLMNTSDRYVEATFASGWSGGIVTPLQWPLERSGTGPIPSPTARRICCSSTTPIYDRA